MNGEIAPPLTGRLTCLRLASTGSGYLETSNIATISNIIHAHSSSVPITRESTRKVVIPELDNGHIFRLYGLDLEGVNRLYN